MHPKNYLACNLNFVRQNPKGKITFIQKFYMFVASDLIKKEALPKNKVKILRYITLSTPT